MLLKLKAVLINNYRALIYSLAFIEILCTSGCTFIRKPLDMNPKSTVSKSQHPTENELKINLSNSDFKKLKDHLTVENEVKLESQQNFYIDTVSADIGQQSKNFLLREHKISFHFRV